MNFEQEILEIKQRNRRVEIDKAWERSWTRRIFISLATYLVALVWLWLINDTSPGLKALVPSAGYLISTLSMPWLKKTWQKFLLDKNANENFRKY